MYPFTCYGDMRGKAMASIGEADFRRGEQYILDYYRENFLNFHKTVLPNLKEMFISEGRSEDWWKRAVYYFRIIVSRAHQRFIS